jgi:hypothetical protein
MCSIYLYINMSKCDVKSISRTINFIFFLFQNCFSQLSAYIIYLFIVFFLMVCCQCFVHSFVGFDCRYVLMSRNSLIIYDFHILTFLQMLLQLSRLSMIEKDIKNKLFSHPSFSLMQFDFSIQCNLFVGIHIIHC